MDNLQSPNDGQSTSNPQNISQPSLAAPTKNLQGSVDVQGQLLKMPASGLKVSSCVINCDIPAGFQNVPTKSSNQFGAASVVILSIVLALLIWRFVAVIKRASSREQPDIEVFPVTQLLNETKTITSSEADKKIIPKTKKTKRRKSNRRSKR